MPRGRTVGSYGNSIFHFLRNFHTVLHSGRTIVSLLAKWMMKTVYLIMWFWGLTELMCENYSHGVWCICLSQNHPKYNKWMSEGRKAKWAMLVITFKSNLWYQSLLLYDQLKMTRNKNSTNQILWLISVHVYYCAFLIVSSLFCLQLSV